MTKIARCQLADIVPGLPAAAGLDLRDFQKGETDSLFLCALGFEPRCLTLPCRLDEAEYRAGRAVYFKYATNADDNAANLPELERHLHRLSGKVEAIEADAPEFPSRLRGLLELVMSESSAQPPCVTFDISVAANRLLLRCVKVLLEFDICVRVIYAEAAVYHPTKDEYGQDPAKWQADDLLGLERGVSDVGTSIDHPGLSLDPLPDALILFPSFKAERSRAVVSFVDPSLLADPGKKVVWLLGVPHLEEDQWRLEAMRNINGIAEWAPQHEVSTFDYRDTLRVLEHCHAEMWERYKVTISPLGSKMQALGTALFCYMCPDVRIIFCTPKEYNATQYSEGCKEVWRLEFGALRELRSKLDMAGTLRLEE